MAAYLRVWNRVGFQGLLKHMYTFKTIKGSIKFGLNGEWAETGMLTVQYKGITPAADLETWRGMDHQAVLTPAKLKSGSVIYPYETARCPPAR